MRAKPLVKKGVRATANKAKGKRQKEEDSLFTLAFYLLPFSFLRVCGV
jgi:hypothetical protein